jgi:DNA-binding NtrC family response regulator
MSYVLVVDDRRDLAQIVCLLVEREGYPNEALLRVRRDQRIDHVITDLVFDGDRWSGLDLAREVKLSHPGVRVYVHTACPVDEWEGAFAAAQAEGVIDGYGFKCQKPSTLEAIPRFLAGLEDEEFLPLDLQV